MQSLKHDAEVMQIRARPVAELLRQQPAGQLDTFYKTYPDVKAAPDALELLYQAAATQNVILEQGEYHYPQNDTDKLMHYEISLPVKGDYLHIRKFLSHPNTLKSAPS